MIGILAGIAGLIAVIAALVIPIERLAFVAVATFVLFVTWNGLRLGGGAIANAFMALAFLAVIAQVIVTRRLPPLPPWLFLAGAGFVLAAMLNLIFPPDQGLINQTLLQARTVFRPAATGYLTPRSDLATLAKFGIALVLVPTLVASVATSVKRIDRLIDMLVISATVNAAVAIVDFGGIPIAPTATRGGRSAGLTIHPNYLALTCTIGLPLALLWMSRGGRWRIAGLVSAGLLLGGEYVSGSRAGAVSILLAIVLAVALLPSLRRAFALVLPAVGMVLVALILFTNVGSKAVDQVRLQGDKTAAGSDTSRSKLASLAEKQFQARPLQGVGFGVIEDAHDIYLQLLAAGGVIAMAAFLVFVGGLFGAAWRRRAGPQHDAIAATSLAVVMWLANGVFDNQLADKYLYVVPGLLMAMSYLKIGKEVPGSRASEDLLHAGDPLAVIGAGDVYATPSRA